MRALRTTTLTTAVQTARRRATTIGLAVAAAGGLLLGAGVATSPTALAVDTVTVDLSNDEADVEAACPSTEGDYWHFIIAPNNDTYSFVTITLNLDGVTFVFDADDIILNGTQTDNIWIEVPTDYELGDLINEGSSAEIAPPTGDPKFVLSHLCDGTNTTTTSTTVPDSTTTTVAETTTTVAETTTTVAATTTTAAATTTTAAETTTTAAETTTTEAELSPPPPANTLDVSSGGPLPTPGPGAQLPSTGGSPSITALLGALLLVGGSILIITSRRRVA